MGVVFSMPSVKVKDGEVFEYALRKFKRVIEKAGIIKELRKREFFQKRSEKRKHEKAAAKKRLLKRISKDQLMTHYGRRKR